MESWGRPRDSLVEESVQKMLRRFAKNLRSLTKSKEQAHCRHASFRVPMTTQYFPIRQLSSSSTQEWIQNSANLSNAFQYYLLVLSLHPVYKPSFKFIRMKASYSIPQSIFLRVFDLGPQLWQEERGDSLRSKICQPKLLFSTLRPSPSICSHYRPGDIVKRKFAIADLTQRRKELRPAEIVFSSCLFKPP